MIMTNDISLPRHMYAFLSFYLRYKRIRRALDWYE